MRLLGLAASIAPCCAQPESFDVATIRPHDSATGVVSGTNFSARGFAGVGTLRDLVQTAYELPDYRVSGGPTWGKSESFYVDARTAAPTTRDHMVVMLQTLLAERFNLQVHRETKELPVYALTSAKKGSKLREVADKAKPGGMSAGKGMLRGQMTLTDLARYLSAAAGRPVIDRTGLSGTFEIDLRWSPDDSSDATGPSLFTAIQEQLGLRLESTKGPVEILVIDRAGRPSPN